MIISDDICNYGVSFEEDAKLRVSILTSVVGVKIRLKVLTKHIYVCAFT